jgi:hypothetical protein
VILVPFILFLVLNLCDLVLTSIFVSHLGYEAEANPILRQAFEFGDGIWPLFVAKVFTTGFAVFALIVSYKEPRAQRLFYWALWAVNCLLGYAVFLGILIVKDL